jgi:homoserine kinase
MVCVYAPASIGNVSVGFDLLGAAIMPIDGSLLGDVVIIDGQSEGDFELLLDGPYEEALPKEQSQNVVYQCCHYFRDELIKLNSKDVSYLTVTLQKRLPVGSGLGSSATSIVATFHALNEYFVRPFERQQLLRMMGKFEGQLSGSIHYDNVAPCYLGGMQLMTDDKDICQSLPVPQHWYWVMAYSGINVSTKMAREVLPKQLPMSTAIAYARNLSAFVDALHRQQSQRAASFIKDVVAEPHRRHLLAGFDEVSCKLNELGVQACGISGSGPTMFAVVDSLEKAQQCRDILIKEYLQNEHGFCHICTIDQQGARVLPKLPDCEEV